MKRLPPFVIFCIIGLLNTAVDVGIFLALSGQGLAIIAANIVSTSVALGVSYFLNKRFTFNSNATTRQTIVPFIAVTLTGLWLLQPAIIYSAVGLMNSLNLFTDNSQLQNLLAKLIATPATIIWNFVLYKRLVFKTPTAAQVEGPLGR